MWSVAFIIKAVTIVSYDTSVVILTPYLAAQAYFHNYAARIVICLLKTWNYDTSILNTSLKDFDNSEQHNTRILNTM